MKEIWYRICALILSALWAQIEALPVRRAAGGRRRGLRSEVVGALGEHLHFDYYQGTARDNFRYSCELYARQQTFGTSSLSQASYFSFLIDFCADSDQRGPSCYQYISKSFQYLPEGFHELFGTREFSTTSYGGDISELCLHSYDLLLFSGLLVPDPDSDAVEGTAKALNLPTDAAEPASVAAATTAPPVSSTKTSKSGKSSKSGKGAKGNANLSAVVSQAAPQTTTMPARTTTAIPTTTTAPAVMTTTTIFVQASEPPPQQRSHGGNNSEGTANDDEESTMPDESEVNEIDNSLSIFGIGLIIAEGMLVVILVLYALAGDNQSQERLANARLVMALTSLVVLVLVVLVLVEEELKPENTSAYLLYAATGLGVVAGCLLCVKSRLYEKSLAWRNNEDHELNLMSNKSVSPSSPRNGILGVLPRFRDSTGEEDHTSSRSRVSDLVQSLGNAMSSARKSHQLKKSELKEDDVYMQAIMTASDAVSDISGLEFGDANVRSTMNRGPTEDVDLEAFTEDFEVEDVVREAIRDGTVLSYVTRALPNTREWNLPQFEPDQDELLDQGISEELRKTFQDVNERLSVEVEELRSEIGSADKMSAHRKSTSLNDAEDDEEDDTITSEKSERALKDLRKELDECNLRGKPKPSAGENQASSSKPLPDRNVSKEDQGVLMTKKMRKNLSEKVPNDGLAAVYLLPQYSRKSSPRHSGTKSVKSDQSLSSSSEDALMDEMKQKLRKRNSAPRCPFEEPKRPPQSTQQPVDINSDDESTHSQFSLARKRFEAPDPNHITDKPWRRRSSNYTGIFSSPPPAMAGDVYPPSGSDDISVTSTATSSRSVRSEDTPWARDHQRSRATKSFLPINSHTG